MLWRSELLARLGDLDGAAEALRQGLRVPKDSPFHRAFKLHLHASDGPWHMVAARVLGPHLVQELYDVTALSHPRRPGAVGDALARLAQAQRRLELAARTGERELAMELMTAMLGEALSPDIRLERLRGREELRALLRPEDWAALERRTRE